MRVAELLLSQLATNDPKWMSFPHYLMNSKYPLYKYLYNLIQKKAKDDEQARVVKEVKVLK